MNKDKDINNIIKDWEYHPGQLNVRLIIGNNGKEKIQMRLELGLLQMELNGRPDGDHPYQRESLLEHYIILAHQHKLHSKNEKPYILNAEACNFLREEAVQYYYRYISFFELKDYIKAERDISRNLRLIEFVKQYAESEEDRMSFEQFRPYLVMMHTRASGMRYLEEDKYKKVIDIIDKGIEDIKQFFNEYEQVELIKYSREIAFLQEWKEEILTQKPLTPLEKLEEELNDAIAEENYERAAELRDTINQLT